MKIIGVDLHTRQQTIAMLDDQTGELVEQELPHEGNQVRDFYAALPKPVLVGIEATGSLHWFLRLLEELGIEFRVGHPAQIRAAEPHSVVELRRNHSPHGCEAILVLIKIDEQDHESAWIHLHTSNLVRNEAVANTRPSARLGKNINLARREF